MDRSFEYRKLSNQSISDFDNLCKALGVTCHEMIQALCIDEEDKYVSKKLLKKGGGFRTVYNPHFLLRKIQRRINNRIFSPKDGDALVSWPKFVYGAVPNGKYDGEDYSKDYISCVRQHCLSKSILKIDIENFFDNISEYLVFDIFKNFFKFPDYVSTVLAKICCYKGFLVQGALTSSYIASLCFYDIETEIFNKVRRKNLNYTRLLDDITVSSKKMDYNYDYIKKIIVDMLYEKEFPINLTKTKVQRFNSEPLLVHGLRISYKEPRLPAKELSKIRAAVKNIENIAEQPKFRVTYNYRKEFYKCLGRVNKLSRLGHNQHKALTTRLMKVHPKPSRKDVKRCIELVKRLNIDFKEKNKEYWYYRRFNLVQDRLNLVKSSYPNLAADLRNELKLIRPTYAKTI